MLWVAVVTGYHLVGLTVAAVILAPLEIKANSRSSPEPIVVLAYWVSQVRSIRVASIRCSNRQVLPPSLEASPSQEKVEGVMWTNLQRSPDGPLCDQEVFLLERCHHRRLNAPSALQILQSGVASRRCATHRLRSRSFGGRCRIRGARRRLRTARPGRPDLRGSIRSATHRGLALLLHPCRTRRTRSPTSRSVTRTDLTRLAHAIRRQRAS